jgi:hypothetical protein
MKKTYILKHNVPIVGVDKVNDIPQNSLKPGHCGKRGRGAVCARQDAWTRGLGLNLNVLAVAENPKTDCEDLENLIHDKLGPYHARIDNGLGHKTREFAHQVKLIDQIIAVCLLAQGTVKNINSADAARFTPTQRGLTWAFNKIRAFDSLIVDEGYTYLRFGGMATKWRGVDIPRWQYWSDDYAVYTGPDYVEEHKLAHKYAMKFNPNKMPVAFNFCKYKPKAVVVN